MNSDYVKLAYVFSCAMLFLVILSPSLIAIVSFSGVNLPAGEEFSDLWILGPDHKTEDYPFTVSVNEQYKVYLGAGNYLGELEYYAIYVKFRNQVEPSPNIMAGLPSPVETVFEYRIFLRNNQTWEKELSFSFDQVEFDGNVSRVSRLIIDGHSVDLDKVAVWDAENRGFFYQIFFELWIYAPASLVFQFHNRSVGMWLNMSSSL